MCPVSLLPHLKSVPKDVLAKDRRVLVFFKMMQQDVNLSVLIFPRM